jgi:hypothetical protein
MMFPRFVRHSKGVVKFDKTQRIRLASFISSAVEVACARTIFVKEVEHKKWREIEF